ncbi:MAG: prolipoprotein diacylglyceryl transferase [Sphaerochaetaceae bacterium]
MNFFLQYPSWIRPEIIPSLPFRWYGLMYVIAFALTYGMVLVQVKRHEISLTREDVDDLFVKCILCLLIGARVFSQLVYEGSFYNWTHPWMIFWPFSNGRFVGLAGMSYHGGVIGAVCGVLWFARKHKSSFFECADALCCSVPLGYTFGRLGNFINGELYGRVSTKPWAMVFPDAPSFSTNYHWVRQIADKLQISYTSGSLVNLPRHPSQLYEALFEGLVLFCIIWFILRPMRHRKPEGFIFGWYLIGYGLIRFVLEYFRAPDANLGYIIKWGEESDNIAIFQSLLNISLGQILCFCMIITGTIIIIIIRSKEKQKNDHR